MAKALSWFRFYAETLNDPKVQLLLAPLFRFWVNVLCLTCGNGGVLPDIPDVAFALRVTEQEATVDVDRLIQAGLLDRTEAGLVPHNWAGRQYLSDCSTERVRKHRVKGNVSETAPRNVSGTVPEQNIVRTDPDPDHGTVKGNVSETAPRNVSGTVLQFPQFKPGEFNLPEFFERQYTRHPKKGNRNIALRDMEEALRSVSPDEFEAGHIAWCECDQWQDKGGRFVKQDLAEWIRDQGWKYPPPGNEDPGSASAIAAELMRRKG